MIEDIKTDARAGADLFRALEPAITAALTARGVAGGNPRDVVLGFLSCFGGYVAAGVGTDDVAQLFTEVADIIRAIK